MSLQECLLQKISDVFPSQEGAQKYSHQQYSPVEIAKAQLRASREWFGAIAALQELLTQTPGKGLFLSGPAPVLNDHLLVSRFYTGVFTPKTLKHLALMPFHSSETQAQPQAANSTAISEFPILANDPITEEQFCLVLTKDFGLVIVLGQNQENIPSFQFSFEPELIIQAWSTLRFRLLLSNPENLRELEAIFQELRPKIPDYRLVTQFSRQLLKNMPDISIPVAKTVEETPTIVINQHQIETAEELALVEPRELELLQALTHEIRTPLTTIRTLTRLLMKKKNNLSAEIRKRLEMIDQECTEQINRMELIFRATELESNNKKTVELIPISLAQLLEQSIPRWKKQAERRNVILEVIVPQNLPQVVSNPAMLDQVLTGVMENFTRSLPTGGEIQVQVTTAGSQLKLQLISQGSCHSNPFKSLGQLLMFQPETGSLSLNLDVTKNIFQALGGKLIVRQRPQQREVFTIFLPLNKSKSKTNPTIFKNKSSCF